ncbi:SAM-dependent methyltransferase [Arthrobacter sp. RIT-PI-e]|uniref:class I SAM-dependent methyltransferase n=1 Tax=Arthrobacter sp. RIT-PI-e TaxID=1681197 RepID=UPI000675EF0B|nr:methyltransferase [Arthrobacter sp. RIT-PI-e]KNC18889.1 SAM-dependent methyltransferase [Arthrobacter sp. RIT-PI-e]
MSPFRLDRLTRHPDIDTPDLVAVDAADRLLLDTAADALRRDTVAVIGDSYGALTLTAAEVNPHLPVRVFQDGIVHQRALGRNAREAGMEDRYRTLPLGAELLAGVSTVLLRLPRSLDELDEIAALVADHAAPDVRVLAGGRTKHMTPTMNDVLGRHFGTVTAGLGRQKARILTASDPRPGTSAGFPRSARHDVGLARPLELRAYGATFGGAALDPGTRLLLPHLLPPVLPTGRTERDPRGEVIDLGCGNGALSAYLALTHPDLVVHATDQSASAVASTRATAAANGVSDRVRVSRDDALSEVPDASARLIVLNPPFHVGSTVHTGIALKLFRACARVLAPGGELYTVWNGHLRYRSALESIIGPTRQLDRSPRFTVTSSRRG